MIYAMLPSPHKYKINYRHAALMYKVKMWFLWKILVSYPKNSQKLVYLNLYAYANDWLISYNYVPKTRPSKVLKSP